MQKVAVNEQLILESRWSKLIDQSCHNLEGCLPQELEKDALLQFKPEMSEHEVFQALIRVAAEKTSIMHPNWQYVAARLFLSQLYQEAGEKRGSGEQGYGNFYHVIKHLTQINRYGAYILEHYTEQEIEELAAYLKPERDTLFTYIGIKTLADRYLIKDLDGSTCELPQELFMGVAMHLAMKEVDKLHWAKQFYDVLSKLEMTVATPTLSNARKPFHQLSSCFIDTVDDNLWSIYHVDQTGIKSHFVFFIQDIGNT